MRISRYQAASPVELIGLGLLVGVGAAWASHKVLGTALAESVALREAPMIALELSEWCRSGFFLAMLFALAFVLGWSAVRFVRLREDQNGGESGERQE